MPAAARTDESGQAVLLLLVGLMLLCVGALVLGGVAQGLTVRGDQQRAADLAALAGGEQMAADHARLFSPAQIAGRLNPDHLERAAYLDRAAVRARATARSNGAKVVAVSWVDAAAAAPLRIRVDVRDAIIVGDDKVAAGARSEAEIVASASPIDVGAGGPGQYAGPVELRQGKPMRPDVARAFDRLAAAASRDGHALLVTSAYRSDAEQAALFARNPDPKWVAPPGKSLHRLGTELDLGPPSAYVWLAANAPRFHFVKRYAWEPWHFGYALNARSRQAASRADGRSPVPTFVPARFAPIIAKAAQRWNVSGALLAAQIHQESGFNPFARSGAGAQGIAQFMPGTARQLGLRNPFDPGSAIDAQARLMRDHLRTFGSVPLALAAYNAGPGAVSTCGCVPNFPETQAYVTRILALLGGVGLEAGLTSYAVRLVR